MQLVECRCCGPLTTDMFLIKYRNYRPVVTLRDTRGSNLGKNIDYREGSRGSSQCLKQAYYPFLPSLFQFIIHCHSTNRRCITDNVVKQKNCRTTEASLPTNVSSQPFHVFKIRNCKSSVMNCLSSWITSLESHTLGEAYFNERADFAEMSQSSALYS